MNANNDSSNTNAWYGSRLALISVKPEKIFCPPAWRRVAGAVAGDWAAAQPPTCGTLKHHAQGWSLVGAAQVVGRNTQAPEK